VPDSPLTAEPARSRERAAAPSRRTALGEIARVFLLLGTTAFGGPAAHIAMMEAEVVRRRGWLSRDDFVDLVGATHLIPGPNSTELAIHLGYRRGGWAGLVVAGVCFIVPAACIVGALAWGYVRWGALPATGRVLAGVQAVAVAVVAQALWLFARSILRTRLDVALLVLALLLTFLGVDELALLAGAGAAAAAVKQARGRRPARAVAVDPAALWPLFALFAKIGSVLFGSGYVLLAFLRTELVERRGWLTTPQLLDAVAAGQVSPGPVFTTATFAGYLVGGAAGAVVATAGIFLPAFAFVALSGPLVPRIRRSPVAGAVLDGVNVASLALMAAVSWQLGRAALVDAPSIATAVGAALLLVRFRVNAAWLVLGGALVGVARTVA
jgi:chromate transporter